MSKHKQWFHISDIMSQVTGVTMSDVGPIEKPDGTLREKYNTAAEGYLKLTEHISGLRLRNVAYKGHYNKTLYDKITDDVYALLREKLEWIKDLEFQQKGL